MCANQVHGRASGLSFSGRRRRGPEGATRRLLLEEFGFTALPPCWLFAHIVRSYRHIVRFYRYILRS